MGRRLEHRRSDAVGQRGGTTLEKSRSALGQVRWVMMIVWGGRKQVATERAVEAMEALLGLTSFQGTCSAVCSWEWARGVGRWSCVVDWGSRCKMRADAIPRNWLFEVCWKLQPTQLPRSLSTGKPLAWPRASL